MDEKLQELTAIVHQVATAVVLMHNRVDQLEAMIKEKCKEEVKVEDKRTGEGC